MKGTSPMPPEDKPKQNIMRQQAGILLKPKNLLRTVASQVPIASIATEFIDQIEVHETDVRIGNVEAEVKTLARLQAMEKANPKPQPLLHDWSIPTSEYCRRTVQIAVVYDGGFHARAQRGSELFQIVAHACIIGDHEVLTCKEALEVAHDVSEDKHGRTVMLVGMAWYDFTSEPADKATGLCTCRLTARDETKWSELAEYWRALGMGEPEHDLILTSAKYSVSPWLGQEVGFIHCGEAQDVMRGTGELTKLQFDTATISHFRLPRKDGLKVFVTGVLPGRVLHAGTGVFSRDGTLLGILSDTEHYPSDAGRRAVVRSLLGHPRFMKTIKKEVKAKHE